MKRTYSRGSILFCLLLMILPGPVCSDEVPAEINRLRRIISQEGTDAAWDYLDSLPPQSQQEVALLAAADPDNAMNTLGITVLVQSGHLDEAVSALSAKVAGRDDLTGFGYSWLHTDGPNLVLRMYLKISRDLLARLDSFTPEQRAHVEHFFRSNREFNPGKHFSVEAIEQRLMRMEAELRKREEN